jgi:hypothetical protein
MFPQDKKSCENRNWRKQNTTVYCITVSVVPLLHAFSTHFVIIDCQSWYSQSALYVLDIYWISEAAIHSRVFTLDFSWV